MQHIPERAHEKYLYELLEKVTGEKKKIVLMGEKAHEKVDGDARSKAVSQILLLLNAFKYCLNHLPTNILEHIPIIC